MGKIWTIYLAKFWKLKPLHYKGSSNILHQHLAENLSDEAVFAMFSNDESILTTARNKTHTEHEAPTEGVKFSNGVSHGSYK